MVALFLRRWTNSEQRQGDTPRNRWVGFQKKESFESLCSYPYPSQCPLTIQNRVVEAARSVLQMCLLLPRNEYDKELRSDPPRIDEAPGSKAKKSTDEVDPATLTLSAGTKLQNEQQGKGI